jgi:ubiquinone/menaquinone biosynthesis C-methylase UbiE
MWWLKKTESGEPLTVSMSGVKLGDRLLVVGCSDAALIAQLALKTGLTGRACALDEDAGRTDRAAKTVEADGALIEPLTAPWTELPLESGGFDVVVIRDVLASLDTHRRAPLVAEALRVLRPGGRCIVIEGSARGGLAALFQDRPNMEYVASGGAEGVLSATGFRAVRMLAEREGLKFVEGAKPGA